MAGGAAVPDGDWLRSTSKALSMELLQDTKCFGLTLLAGSGDRLILLVGFWLLWVSKEVEQWTLRKLARLLRKLRRRVSADILLGSKCTSPANVTRFSLRDEVAGTVGLISSSGGQVSSLIKSLSYVAESAPPETDERIIFWSK